MFGLVLDNIIVYLFRTVRRLIRENRSVSWPVTQGKVLRAYSADSASYPQAEVIYTYRVGGKLYTGMHTMAFWCTGSAADYAGRFVQGQDLPVRYRPDQPAMSVVRKDE